MALTPKLMSLKGDISARVHGTTGAYKPFLNAISASLAITAATVKQKSNGNTPGTLAEDETDLEATFECALQSRHKENVTMFLRTVPVERIAGTAVAFTLPVGAIGDIVDLGKSGVSNAVFGTKVEGTDYALLPKTGQITYLAAFAATVAGTFDHAAYTEHGILNSGSQEIELLFTSEKSGETYILYRLKLSPAATYALLEDGNNFANSVLKGSLLVDPSAPNTDNLGQYGRLRAAA
jgi:hypothetical protein